MSISAAQLRAAVWVVGFEQKDGRYHLTVMHSAEVPDIVVLHERRRSRDDEPWSPTRISYRFQGVDYTSPFQLCKAYNVNQNRQRGSYEVPGSPQSLKASKAKMLRR